MVKAVMRTRHFKVSRVPKAQRTAAHSPAQKIASTKKTNVGRLIALETQKSCRIPYTTAKMMAAARLW